MDSNQSWQTAFGYSGSENLSAVLASNQIPPEKYLSWASTNYQLPILNSEFLKQSPPDFLWHSVQQLAAWSPQMVPIGEWEQVLIIACIEPPQTPIGFPHCLVLAPQTALTEFWQRLNPNSNGLQSHGAKMSAPVAPAVSHSAAMPIAPPVAQAPQAMKIDLPPLATPPLATPPIASVSITPLPPSTEPQPVSTASQALPKLDVKLNVPPTKPTTAPPNLENSNPTTTAGSPVVEEPVLEAPEGIKLSKIQNLQALGKNPEGLDLATDNLPEIGEKPEGLSIQKPNVSLTEPDGFGKMEMTLTPITLPNFGPETTQSAATPPDLKIVPAPTPAAAPAPEPEAPIQKAAEGAAAKIASTGLGTLNFPPPPLPKKPPGIEIKSEQMNSAELSIHHFESGDSPVAGANVSSLELAKNYDEATAIAFKMVHPTYEKSMLLLFQSGELKPWKWSGLAPTANSKIQPIDLKNPNIFRIVFNSHLPYHGKISPNDINSAFFNQFNEGQTPKHVTIVPVNYNRSMVAMLLATTEQAIDLKSSLALMEKIAAHLSKTFERIKKAG